MQINVKLKKLIKFITTENNIKKKIKLLGLEENLLGNICWINIKEILLMYSYANSVLFIFSICQSYITLMIFPSLNIPLHRNIYYQAHNM